MTTNSTKREILFMISEIEETRNPFAIALKLVLSLKDDKITSNQYELLTGELFYQCERLGILTENEICSL